MKNNIIKASEEVFPIDKEMGIDEQCDQFLRQVGFKSGANWAIEKACEWLSKNTYSVFTKSCTLFDAVEEFVENFKQEMKGGEE